MSKENRKWKIYRFFQLYFDRMLEPDFFKLREKHVEVYQSNFEHGAVFLDQTKFASL
jgi:hypothetical protein